MNLPAISNACRSALTHPIMAMVVVIAACLLGRDSYPLNNFPMYADPGPEASEFVIVADGDDRPLDIRTLTEMRFPVWAKAMYAQGTVKETLGTVNLPIVCAGQLVRPGDVILADDDGVLVIPQQEIESALSASHARVDKEAAMREKLAAGGLSIDLATGMRARLVDKGLRFVDDA